MESKEIKSLIDQGWIHTIILFEVVGNPKEHVAKAIETVVKKVSENNGIKIVDKEIGEPEDAGEGLFGAFCEAEILVKDIRTLSWIAFNFMPASIDIKAPAKLTFKDKEITDFFGEVLAHVHESNKRVVATNSTSMGMLRSINALVRNAILIALHNGEKTSEELALKVGIPEKDTSMVLDAMIKEKTVEKKGDKFKAVKK